MRLLTVIPWHTHYYQIAMYIENFEDTEIALSAKFNSELITLSDAAEFFKFLSEAFEISLQHSFPPISSQGLEHPVITSNVTVEAGSIKAFIQVLKSRDFQVGVSASLTASIIWAAATYPWGDYIEVESNVPEQQTIYRIPVDPQLTAMTEAMNKSGKPWSIEITAKDPRYAQELSITLKGNQPQHRPQNRP